MEEEENWILLPIKISESEKNRIVLAKYFPVKTNFNFNEIYISQEALDDLRNWGVK